jgi:cytochrome c-type biogenesis protein CcmH/NrfG
MQKGWEAYVQGDFLLAETTFRQAVDKDPNNIDGLYALGMTLRYDNKYPLAIKVFQKVIEMVTYLEDQSRARMIRRLALGHIHQMETGDWNLEKEVWSRKR